MRNSTFAAHAAHHFYPHQDPSTQHRPFEETQSAYTVLAEKFVGTSPEMGIEGTVV